MKFLGIQQKQKNFFFVRVQVHFFFDFLASGFSAFWARFLAFSSSLNINLIITVYCDTSRSYIRVEHGGELTSLLKGRSGFGSLSILKDPTVFLSP